MDGVYTLLKVEKNGRDVWTTLPLADVVCSDVRPLVYDDFRQLAHVECDVLWLDLRAVEQIHGDFVTQLIVLARAVQSRSARLVVIPSAGLAEVFRITRTDRLFQVADAPPGA